MSGYAISVEEVHATCRRLIGSTSAAPDLAGEVGRTAFGDAHADALGARYVAAVHGPLAAAVRDFDEARRRLADSLLAGFEGYQHADDDARHQLQEGRK